MLQCGLHAVPILHTTHPNSCAARRKACYKESIMVWVEDVGLSLEESLLTTSVITRVENISNTILDVYFYIQLCKFILFPYYY